MVEDGSPAFKPGDFPGALNCFQRAVSLPVYSRMSEAEVEQVIETVGEICRNNR
ncbi:MAG: DegT/DnrJ/EryC1/StrS family aminotransferase [Thermodesulfobacteriota bacterium]